jgi:hypothetical protein
MQGQAANNPKALPGPKWISPAAVAERLGVSRAQVSRLAAKHGWKRLDVSISPKARNAGVRYSLDSVLSYEETFTY